MRLCTIHFYIILKLDVQYPGKLLGLCTIHFYIILKRIVANSFEAHRLVYHTFLHHSQTNKTFLSLLSVLVYHTFLHHSQTRPVTSATMATLVYHTFLHHSQTCVCNCSVFCIACVPYIFTSFSNVSFVKV